VLILEGRVEYDIEFVIDGLGLTVTMDGLGVEVDIKDGVSVFLFVKVFRNKIWC
jgi:hypothetical protein